MGDADVSGYIAAAVERIRTGVTVRFFPSGKTGRGGMGGTYRSSYRSSFRIYQHGNLKTWAYRPAEAARLYLDFCDQQADHRSQRTTAEPRAAVGRE